MSDYLEIVIDSHSITALSRENQTVRPPHISVGAFFDRFGAQKIAILSDADATVQACIKDAAVRQFIDLSRPDLPAMLDLIIASGYAISKPSVLSLTISDAERP